MKVAFCDDDVALAALLQSYAEAWGLAANRTMECSTYRTSEEFLLAWTSSTKFDAIFLDIEMGTLSGLELARVIRSINNDVSIVFVTGHSEYALEGYSVDATHFLLKPVARETFFECLNKIEARMRLDMKSTFLIEKGGKTIKLHYDELLYFESLAHILKAHTTRGAIEYRAKISDIEQRLTQQDGFVRIHRSFLVNINHVRIIDKTELIMENDDRLPIGRSYAREVRNEYIKRNSSRP